MWIELTTGQGLQLFNLTHFYAISPNREGSKHKSVLVERDPDGTTTSWFVEEDYGYIKLAIANWQMAQPPGSVR